MVERLAYVLREWEEDHAGWAQPMVNGSIMFVPDKKNPGDPDPEPMLIPRIKTPCECRHCVDARVVLEDYDERGGDDKADRIKY